MGTKVFDLFGDLSLNSGQFRRDVNQARTSLRSGTAQMNRILATHDKTWRGVSKGIGTVRTGLGGLIPVLGVAAGVSGFAGLVRNAGLTADALVDVSQKVSLTTSELQELRFAGEEAGVQQNTFDQAMQRFARRVGEAANGTGELKDTLKEYNIQVRNSNGTTRSQVDILNDLADAMAGAESDQERLRIAFKAFDSEGAALVNVLRNGSTGLDEFRRRARELGLVLDDEGVAALDRYNDAVRRLGQRIQTGINRAIGETVIFFEDLSAVIKEGRLAEAFTTLGDHGFDLAKSLRAINSELTETTQKAEATGRALLDMQDRALQGAPDLVDPTRNARPKEKPTSPTQSARLAAKLLRDQAGDIRGSVRESEALRDTWRRIVKEIAAGGDGIMSTEAALRTQAGDIRASVIEAEKLRGVWAPIINEIGIVDAGLKKAADTGRMFGETLADSLADAALEGKSVRDILRSIINDVIRSGLRSALGNIGASIGGSLFKGGGGGSLFSGIGKIFGFAKGGDLARGQTALVGEEGPELITAKRPATITPNNAMGGGRRIVIGTIDNRGASLEAVQETRRMLEDLNANLEPRAVAATTAARTRDPGLFE